MDDSHDVSFREGSVDVDQYVINAIRQDDDNALCIKVIDVVYDRERALAHDVRQYVGTDWIVFVEHVRLTNTIVVSQVDVHVLYPAGIDGTSSFM